MVPWTVAHQASLSMGFSRQEYWSGFSFPSPGDLPNLGSQPSFPALQAVSCTVGRFFTKCAIREAQGHELSVEAFCTGHLTSFDLSFFGSLNGIMNSTPASIPWGGNGIHRAVGLDSEIKFNVLIVCCFISETSSLRVSVFSSANRDNNILFTARGQICDLELK